MFSLEQKPNLGMTWYPLWFGAPILGLLLLLQIPLGQASDSLGGFVLLSSEDLLQLDRELDAYGQSRPPLAREESHPQGPNIVVRAPAGSEIQSPLSLDIAFAAQGDAEVALDSLTVKYKKSFLWLDVTDRLLRNAEVTPDGVRASMPSVPRGKHAFVVSLADSLGRRSFKTMEFVCVDG